MLNEGFNDDTVIIAVTMLFIKNITKITKTLIASHVLRARFFTNSDNKLSNIVANNIIARL